MTILIDLTFKIFSRLFYKKSQPKNKESSRLQAAKMHVFRKYYEIYNIIFAAFRLSLRNLVWYEIKMVKIIKI